MHNLQADSTGGQALLLGSIEAGAGDHMSRWTNSQTGSASVLLHGKALKSKLKAAEWVPWR